IRREPQRKQPTPTMYERFQEVDGKHPWRDVSPDGFVDYQARYRPHGRVLYFNFALAKEMGLIPLDHAASVSKDLEQVILDTFSLQIINEYDVERGKKYPPETIKPSHYMATRYLQIQHRSRQGKTSGDGRSIWNGYIQSDHLIFDISSRGTGATILSPGAQEADRPLPTGDETYGYSSGLAHLDEMLGSAVMSEIFYRQGIPTERCLAVIGFPDTSAIGVRTAPNLIRPAHMFRYLKQSRHEELKASVDYFIDREVANGFWDIPSDPNERYTKALDYFARSYAKLAATLEEEYIFNWLSWDGDNMLASGAILDYGSIRQFAAKHDKYRYNDVDRYSASLAEQRGWARSLVQVFAQTMAFVQSGVKENLNNFKNAGCLRVFDDAFQNERDQRLLWRIGFTSEQISYLMSNARKEIRDFERSLRYFEDRKVKKGIEKLPDGLTHSPVFLIRNLLRLLPAYYVAQTISRADDASAYMPDDIFCRIMAASYAGNRDLKPTPSTASHVQRFQQCYLRLVAALGGPFDLVLKTLQDRSAVINHRHRITGDAVTWIIEEVIAMKSKIKVDGLQEALDAFIDSQVLIPGKWQPVPPEQLKSNTLKSQLLQKIHENLETYKESI
ncbi:MAG TPA: protein adenylyltransferase SelO family protein, partial [Pyrinomonadaceae bacterium]|nr:protein adenylyltransferase SelO family protein [Pyrinomonadaceae bacterium]